MSHARTQIRAALVAALTGLPTTLGSVFVNRVYSHKTVPSLNIITGDEEIEGQDFRTRRMDVEIQARVKAVATVDDDMDQIALEVEGAIGADPTLGGVVLWMVPRALRPEKEAGSDRNVAMMRIEYTAMYRVDPAAPDVLIN